MLTEENIYANTQGFREAVGFEESDVLLMALPLFHAYGLTVCLYAFTLGRPSRCRRRLIRARSSRSLRKNA